MIRSLRLFLYISAEMLPTFILGNLIFISILLMFQTLRLTEFMLVHGIKFNTILDILGYLSISFLPMILPMSLLFSVLMTYNRLSQDSEIIAFKSAGYHGYSLLAPALVLALFVAGLSAQTAFFIAPWGNRQFELLITQLSNTKAAASIKEGTFSEGFFDMVVYANKVNSEQGILKDLFIYDDKNPNNPITIIAPEGHIIPDAENPGHSILLRIFNGQIHRRGLSHTVINFETYDVTLNDPIKFEEKKKSGPSLNYFDLKNRLNSSDSTDKEKFNYKIEMNKRIALSLACIVFALIGFSYGVQNNRRSGKSSGFVLSVGFIILYWVLYLAAEGIAHNQNFNPLIATNIANISLMALSYKKLRENLI